MKVLRLFGGMIFCSLVAGGAGGMAGGGMLAMWSAMAPLVEKGIDFDAFFVMLPLAVGAAVIFAMFGIAFGAIFGFVPAFVVGLALTALARWRPFQSAILWALAGAGSGFAVVSLFAWHRPLDSMPAWVFGGAVAMVAYWGLGLRVFKLRLMPASSTQT